MEIIPHLQWTHCKTLFKESKSDPMRTMAWGRHRLHFTEIKTKGMYINCLYYKNDSVPRSYRPKKKRKMHIKSLGEMGLLKQYLQHRQRFLFGIQLQAMPLLTVSVCQYYYFYLIICSETECSYSRLKF